MSNSNIWEGEEEIKITEFNYELKQTTSIKSKVINFTFDNAFIIEKGNVKKGEDILPLNPDFSSDYKYNEEVNPTVDTNIKNVYSYLDQITQVLNQHAVIINNEKLKKKEEYILKSDFINFIDNLDSSLTDNNNYDELVGIKDLDLFPINTKDELDNKKNSIYNKFKKIGNYNTYLINNNFSINNRVDDLKKELNLKLEKKIDNEIMNWNLQELDNKFFKKMDINIKEINNKINKIDNKNKKLFNNFDFDLKELDKVIKSKLKDFDQLLNLRVSDQKLYDSLRILEEKIKRMFNTLKLENKESFDLIHKQIDSSLLSELEVFNEKILKLEDNISSFKDDIENCANKNSIEDLEQYLNDKSDSLFLKIKDITKKYDPMFGKIDILTKNLSNFTALEDKLLDLESNLHSLKEKLGNEIEEIKNAPAPMLEQKIELPHIPQIDENEFEEMKFWTKKLKNNFNEINTSIASFNKNLNNKVDNNIFERLWEKKIDKDDVYILMEKFTVEDDKHNNLKKEVKELNIIIQKFMEKTTRKFKKLTNDLDLASIQKLLKSKADDNEIKREFENFDSRYNFINDLVGCMKKDLDGIFNSLRKITDVISLLQQEQAHALASTKTTLCLSCGRGDANFLPSKPYIQGNDGKIYKGDCNIKQNNYDIGYNVFDKKEIVKEHDNLTHKKLDVNKKIVRLRPTTAIPKAKNNLGNKPIKLDINKIN